MQISSGILFFFWISKALGFASAFNWSFQVSRSFVLTMFLVTSFLAEVQLGVFSFFFIFFEL